MFKLSGGGVDVMNKSGAMIGHLASEDFSRSKVAKLSVVWRVGRS